MREIKFRGKRLDNGQWAYGDLIENQGRLFIYHATSESTIEDNEDGSIVVVAVEVDLVTVGQYTGLKDKNGVEIWEGDIIRFTNPYLLISQGKQSLGVVKYYNALAGFALYNSSEDKFPVECDWQKIEALTEALGNIYDTPELLKGGEK